MRELSLDDLAVLDQVVGGLSIEGEYRMHAWSLTGNPAFARGFFDNVMVKQYGWTNDGKNFNTFMQGAAGAAMGVRGGAAGAVMGAISGAVSSGTFYA